MALLTIDELHDMWAKDAAYDRSEPSKELANIPKLHAKYLRIMSDHTLIAKKLKGDLKRLEAIKHDYYSGDLNNPEDLAEHNLQPFLKKVLRTDVPKYIARDKEIIDLSLKIDLYTQIALDAESIVGELKSRTFQLRDIVSWEKFIGGA